jgi:hypothetical protein
VLRAVEKIGNGTQNDSYADSQNRIFHVLSWTPTKGPF